jgi:OOP family OmpA-OmpF porin
MKLRGALLSATVLVAPIAAMAQPVSGVYIGAGAGVNFMQDSTLSNLSFPAAKTKFAGSATLSHDVGMVGVVSVGYGLGNGLRLEIEGGVRQNALGSVSIANVNVGGDEVKYSAMFNALYDFDLSAMGSPIMPYVGLGAGYAYAQNKNVRFSTFSGGTPLLLRSTAGDGAFAYQAILGAALPIAAVPGLALTLEYRFMGLGTDRTTNFQTFAGNGSTRARVKQTDDYNHSILVGFRYAFNAAPAAVAAPIAPAPVTASRTYLVFFDWDRADLTDRARQIIAEAAQATTKVAVTRIEVSGHTDTTGTAKYNQGLSVRRAQNVAAELVRLGVPKAAITTQGFGFSKPLVATGPNVREPQNRRVEIVLK